VAHDISGETPASMFADNIIGTVLVRTEIGQDWIARLALAGLLAAMLPSMRRGWLDRLHQIGAVGIAAALVGTLALAGHARGTEGAAGGIHLFADILHLIAATAWVGALMPLSLLLHAARGDPAESRPAIALVAIRRFSTLGIGAVAVILTTGAVNVWFLAGSVPALVGTYYGRLLLVKIALFMVMVSIAAINRVRITPRLASATDFVRNRHALRQLERNSAIEALLGAVILGIVGALGATVPGLHDQAIWPFPFRIDPAVFSDQDFYIFVVFGVVWIAGGLCFPQFRWPAIAVGIGVLILIALRLPFIEAYPTTFYSSPTEFSVKSVVQGARIFAANCAVCHGADGRGRGPAAAALNPMPADLTADHIYEHSDGDLFWWITHGIAPTMPPFGDQLGDRARWNLVDFIHANADAIRLRALGAGTTAAFPTPDFSVECRDGATQSIAQLRPQIVHIVVADRAAQDWLFSVVARDVAGKLATVVVGSQPVMAKNISLCVAEEPETIQAFALYSGDVPVEGREFLVDAEGELRSMWYAEDKANGEDANSLERRVQGLRIAPQVRRPSGMQGHHHH
jgi:putative copper export protein/mono/diheme cytochrome c family protein